MSIPQVPLIGHFLGGLKGLNQHGAVIALMKI